MAPAVYFPGLREAAGVNGADSRGSTGDKSGAFAGMSGHAGLLFKWRPLGGTTNMSRPVGL